MPPCSPSLQLRTPWDWHAAARKLIGILVYPAAALGVAAYPTLCRLYTDNLAAFRKTAADSMHLVTIVVVPVALGCALFPQIGIEIFSATAYGPAQNNLRILALFLLLVYFSVIMGTCITSSGRQVPWTIVQFASVVISAACDPPLIIWFQAHTGNGGLGVCVATVGSEVLMLAGGLYLLPKGILGRAMLRDFGKALLAGRGDGARRFVTHRIRCADTRGVGRSRLRGVPLVVRSVRRG